MRTPMTYPIRFWAFLLACLLLYQFSSEVFADSCAYKKDIDLTMDVSGSETLAIAALAGELVVTGKSHSNEAVIHGKVCASKESWLEGSTVETASGKHSVATVVLPDHDSNWSLWGNQYLRLDLRIEVPDDLALEVRDSSGGMTLDNIGPLHVEDSSGDIEINNVTGDISIRDSSGDIEVEQVEGNVTVDADSSGEIDIRDVNGNVLVKQDSSGDIYVTGVSNDVVVERDSSGSISVRDIGGDFRVLKDGSGGISSHDVKGKVEIPTGH